MNRRLYAPRHGVAVAVFIVCSHCRYFDPCVRSNSYSLSNFLSKPHSPLFSPPAAETVTVVMCRHGESEWNALNQFCGWFDAKLSESGIKEAQAGGAALKAQGYSFDAAHSSVLQRVRSSTLFSCGHAYAQSLEHLAFRFIREEPTFSHPRRTPTFSRELELPFDMPLHHKQPPRLCTGNA